MNDPLTDPGTATPSVPPAEVGPRATSYSRIELATVMPRSWANLLGDIHGGEIVKLADSAAGVVAQRHSGGPAVTAALDEMAFLQPVRIGDVVRTSAQANWVGSSSMEIGVRVETQPWDDPTSAMRHVASAYFVFVAIDPAGRPRPVPALLAEGAEDERRRREAQIRRSHRLARRTEIEAARREAR